MNKFIVKTILFCFLFYFLCYFLVKYHTYDKGLNKELEYKVNQLVDSNRKSKLIVFAGDSRAERQLIPKLISKKLGVKCINLGVSSGELISFIPYLKLFNPDSTFFVFSVSSFQINDKLINSSYLSFDTYKSLNFYERYFLYRYNIIEFLKLEHLIFKYTFNRFIRSSQNSYSPNEEKKRMINELGYLKRDGFLKLNYIDSLIDKDKHFWYKEISSNGLRLKSFRSILDLINTLGYKSLLYQPPVSPIWHQKIRKTKIDRFEKYFSKFLGDFSRTKKNLHFLDFYNHTILDLTDSMFCDCQHLNVKGAIKFSDLMADSIKLYY